MNNNIISLAKRLPVIGHIKIGRKGNPKTSSNGKQFQQPEKLDHFLITSTSRGDDNNLILDNEMMGLISPSGNPITEIPIRLIYDDIDQNFRSRFCRYDGKTAACYGDGVTAMERQMASIDGRMVPQMVEIKCSCGKEKPDYGKLDKCKINGALVCIVEGAEFFGGVWRFSTTSFNSTLGILSSLQLLSLATHGNISNIPMLLRLDMKTVQTPGGQTTIGVVSIVARGTIEQVMINAQNSAQMRLQSSDNFRQLAHRASCLTDGPILEDDDIIEYYPETQDGYEPAAEKPGKETPAQRIADAVAAKQPAIKSDVSPSQHCGVKEMMPIQSVADGPLFAAGDEVRVTSTKGETADCQILEIFDEYFILDHPDKGLVRMPKSAIVEMIKL